MVGYRGRWQWEEVESGDRSGWWQGNSAEEVGGREVTMVVEGGDYSSSKATTLKRLRAGELQWRWRATGGSQRWRWRDNSGQQ
ncbi:hypothetical protein B296_00000524, partial [Ensete ventricosum]